MTSTTSTTITHKHHKESTMLDLNDLSHGQCKALAAADSLFEALRHLNDADGRYASGAADRPLGAVEQALKITLVEALGEELGTKLYEATIEAYDFPRNLLRHF